eukprot:15453138-Alexandrium_andersonii.AAC.1
MRPARAGERLASPCRRVLLRALELAIRAVQRGQSAASTAKEPGGPRGMLGCRKVCPRARVCGS